MRVLSLGAGVQSSALYLKYVRGEFPDPPDCAVFADTRAEPKSVYEWLEILKQNGQHKIPIYIVSKGNLGKDHLSGKRFASIPFFIKNKDGSQGMGRRQCTAEYKIMEINKFIRSLMGYRPGTQIKETVQMLIGISTDEAHRMKPSRIPWIENCYPLIDQNWDRTDCYNYLSESELGTPPKSACYMCPYRNNESWLYLKESDPKAFEKAIEFEKEIQQVDAERGKWEGVPYLHRSMKPIGEVDFKAHWPNEPLFGGDCEGMCGV